METRRQEGSNCREAWALDSVSEPAGSNFNLLFGNDTVADKGPYTVVIEQQTKLNIEGKLFKS